MTKGLLTFLHSNANIERQSNFENLELLITETYITLHYITRQAMHLKRDFETHSPNCCCLGKAISVKYFECVYIFALFIWQANSLRHIILSSVACLAVPQFTHCLTNDAIFGGKNLIKHKNVFWFFKTLV